MVREVWEETGLAASINGYLGVAEYDMSEYGRAGARAPRLPVGGSGECPHRVLGPRARGQVRRGLWCGSRLSWLHLDDPAWNWRRATVLT